MSQDFKTLEQAGRSRVIKGINYFPTLMTDYKITKEGIFVYQFVFNMDISKDTKKDADPSYGLRHNAVHSIVDLSLEEISFRKVTNATIMHFESTYPKVFTPRSFFETYLPLWNDSRKKLEQMMRSH